MDQEFEYAVEQRRRRNQTVDGVYPDPPNWGEWSEWGGLWRAPYQSLAGAAMGASAHSGIHRTYGRSSEERKAHTETQARVVYRMVPKGWTPLLPETEQ